VVTRVGAALFHTQGGLMVDTQARVLRTDGTPIPNLLAGGGAAVGLSGKSGGGGYVSGNGLLTATVLGYIAGETAASGL
jgi:fumarate reductase flavoprotein subunit